MFGWVITLFKIDVTVRKVIHVLVVIYAVLIVLQLLGVMHGPHFHLR